MENLRESNSCEPCLHRMGVFTLAFIAFSFVFSSSAFSSSDPDYAWFEKKIERYTEDNPGVTLSYQLISKGDVLASGTFGESRKLKNPVYRAGSLAKIFTALGVLLLEERGSIDIDQPVSAYLPRFNIKRRFTNDQPITIRNILTHHSGLPTNIIKGQWSNAHFTTVIEQLRHEYLTYPPDFVMAYSNVGYSVLGALIEEVAEQSYESYIKENILDPLGMMNTNFNSESVSSPGFVNAYKDGKKAMLLPIRDTPAMGLYTTAEDMGKLLIMMTSGGVYQDKIILDSQSLDEMFAQQNTHVTLDYDTQVGLGMVLNHCEFNNSGTETEHGGSTMYYSSHLITLPQSNTAAIVLSNYRQAKKLTHRLANDLVTSVVSSDQSDNKIAHKSDEPIPENTAVEKPAAISGTYLTRSGLLKLSVDEQDLCACMNDKRLNLMPAPDGWYSVEKNKSGSPSLKISPQQVQGKQVIVINKDGREQRLGEYIPDKEIPAAWENRLGDYLVSNPDQLFPLEEVCLIKKDNLIYLSYRMPRLSDSRIDLPLTPLNNKEAITSGMGRGRGETVKAMETDDGEYLLYSGFLIQKEKEPEAEVY